MRAAVKRTIFSGAAQIARRGSAANRFEAFAAIDTAA